MTPHRSGIPRRGRQFGARTDGTIATWRELRRPGMTALTIRLRNAADRDAVERLKDATGEGTASRAILRAVREWPGLVEELAAERRTVEDLRTALLDIVEAEASLAGAQAHRTSALEAAATVTDRMAT